MATPKGFLDMFELHHQFARRLALDVLHDPAGRHMGRRRDEQMNMFTRHMDTQDFNVVGPAHFPDQLSYAYRDLPLQNRAAILRDPHEMVFKIETCMR